MSTKWDRVMATFGVDLTKQDLYDTLMEISQDDRNDIVCEALCNDIVLRKAVIDMFKSWEDEK